MPFCANFKIPSLSLLEANLKNNAESICLRDGLSSVSVNFCNDF